MGGGVVHLQVRVAGGLRPRGVGSGPSLLEWEGGNVWRVVRGRDPIPGGDRAPSAPGGNLSHGDGVELSRRLDVSGRSGRAVVQRIVDDRVGRKHPAEARGT